MTGRRKKKAASGRVKPAVLWFTGLSGSGKSAIAEEVKRVLIRRGVDVEWLDGDVLRGVFPQTGFTRQARDEHIKRVGYVASLLEKHGVFVIATFVSPYREARRFVRKLCRRFIEVHVSTPLAVCEKRDVKGLYAKARRGEIKHFTGVSDPYEPPRKPEIVIDTAGITVAEASRKVLGCL